MGLSHLRWEGPGWTGQARLPARRQREAGAVVRASPRGWPGAGEGRGPRDAAGKAQARHLHLTFAVLLITSA